MNTTTVTAESTDFIPITKRDCQEQNDRFVAFVERLTRMLYPRSYADRLSSVYVGSLQIAEWYQEDRSKSPLGQILYWRFRWQGSSRFYVDYRRRRHQDRGNCKREREGKSPLFHAREIVEQPPDDAPTNWELATSREPDPQAAAETAEEVRNFVDTVARLKPEQAEAIERGIFQDVNDHVEAERLNMTHQAISLRRKTALANLARMLGAPPENAATLNKLSRIKRKSIAAGRKAAP